MEEIINAIQRERECRTKQKQKCNKTRKIPNEKCIKIKRTTGVSKRRKIDKRKSRPLL